MLCIAVAINLLLVCPAFAFAGVFEGNVVKIADSDTITVLDSNRQQHRIRLAGIDAPEKGQPFGNASRKRLSELVAGKDVRVEFDKYDRYGRIVGKVWVTPQDCPTCCKTLDVGLAQLTMEMAWWYRKYAHEQSPEDQGRYEFAEKEAKAKRAGLWQDKNPQPPWVCRHKGRSDALTSRITQLTKHLTIRSETCGEGIKMLSLLRRSPPSQLMMIL